MWTTRRSRKKLLTQSSSARSVRAGGSYTASANLERLGAGYTPTGISSTPSPTRLDWSDMDWTLDTPMTQQRYAPSITSTEDTFSTRYFSRRDLVINRLRTHCSICEKLWLLQIQPNLKA